MRFLVLPPDDALVERVRREASDRGWTLDVSPGEEQAIACVAEGGDPAELVAALPDAGLVDVVTVRDREHYARRRARRRFLTVLVAGLGILTATGWAIPIVDFLRPPLEPLEIPGLASGVTVQPPRPGEGRRVRFGGRPILLVHREDGSLFALEGRCGFMDGGLLEWSPGPQHVVCPVHGCTFDVRGNVLGGPAWLPLSSYAVELTPDGRARVDWRG